MKNSQIDYDRLIILALAALFAASLALTIVSVSVGNSPMLIVGDGKGYYAWARSVILDGDIDFTNDYKLLYPPDIPPGYMGVRTPNGLVSNVYSIGMAIIEIPGLLAAHCATLLLFPEKADGVSLLYQICITWPLIALILFSFHLLYRAMLSMGASKPWAFWFCITALVGSNLIHYVAKETAMSHGAGVALINFIVFLITRYDKEQNLPSWVKIIRLGLLTGLLLLVRNTNIVILPSIAALAFIYFRFRARDIICIAAVAIPVTILQPVALYYLWGEPRLTPYYLAAFNSGLQGITVTLFSLRHGLFIINPWYAVLLFLALWGLSIPGRLRNLSLWTLISFAGFSIINGLWSFSMFGHCFGSRAFIELLPMLSVAGSLVATEKNVCHRRILALMTCMLISIVLNIYLWLGFLLRAYSIDWSNSISYVYLWIFRVTGHQAP
ncbi:MAG: hypothetical protein AB2L14_19080 [Candidatus Xenobiia bacterium LiM19]